jgi:hypothetical protein
VRDATLQSLFSPVVLPVRLRCFEPRVLVHEAIMARFAPVVVLALAGGCGGGPQVKATSDYRATALVGHRVLFVPLAVSDDLGDKRTGVVLSRGTCDLASASACGTASKSWSDGGLVCPEAKALKESTEVSETMQHFALDEPIPADLWRRLQGRFQADYALLFRPEGVSSSKDVEHEYLTRKDRNQAVGLGAVSGGLLGAVIASNRTEHSKTTSDAELSYTVSAALVDMRTGRLLKVGVNSGSASKTVHRDVGVAETPPAAPLLEKILTELAEEVLDK